MQLKPNNILEPERFLLYEGRDNSLMVPIVIKLIHKENTKICDVGGASGKFLNEIIFNSKHKVKATIIEVEDYYKDNQVNNNIEFVNASILNNGIDDNYFDIVVFRHLLHHLVSNNLQNTIEIQKLALNEIFRITKNNGFLIFIEQVNEIEIFSRIIYFLSKVANKFNIYSKFFSMGKVVVYFLSPKKIDSILKIFEKKYNLIYYKKKFLPWNLSLRWKLTLLMSKIGSVFYIIKIQK